MATLHLTTGFTKIISGLRSVSTLHQLLMNIHFYLNYHSVGYFNMYYFGRRLSFKHIKIHKKIKMSSDPLSPIIFLFEVINNLIIKYHICILMVLGLWL